jgi:dephospho-CoA kinase
MIKKIAITGNIGSGKTTVSRIFESVGVPVFYADEVAKSLYQKPHVIKSVLNTFGDTICDDGNIVLKKLASIVFSNPHEMKKLEEIIHPEVKKEFILWASSQHDSKIVIMENAVLFEGGFQTLFDYVIVVACPTELRLERIMKRDGLTRQQVIERMNLQIDENEKIKKADFVIVNDGKEALLPQISEIMQIF